MLRESLNNVVIEGILNEVDLEKKVDKNGKTYIGGKITLLVQQVINGVEDEDIIPINFFQYELKKDKTLNKNYERLDKFMQEYQSVASLGGDEAAKQQADRYNVTGKMEINTFPSQDGSLVENPVIRGSFLNKRTKNFTPDSSFETEIMLKKIVPEVTGEDGETGRLLVDGIVVQYNERPDIFHFVVGDANAVDYINTYWNTEETVKVEGSIRWTTVQKTVDSTEEVGFGSPKKKVVERTKKEFVITAGSAERYPEETAFNLDEMLEALANKKAENESKMKPKAKAGRADRGF